jgi:hypothetical protein
MAEEKQEDTRQGLPENVNVEIADAPMELQEPIEGDDSQGFIKYVGVATVRQMAPHDWRNAGVDDFDEYVEWNALNGMCVPRSIFTDKALDYLLNKDGRFVKVDSK